MGGRITDELRRITREQHAGEAPADAPPSAPVATSGLARYSKLVVVLLVALVAGGGWWLVRTMQQDSKLQDCVMSGRKNCVPGVESPPP
jgi:hypothetical protein